MKHLTKTGLTISVLSMFALSPSYVWGQEWSAEQKEIWKYVETAWVDAQEEDMEGLLSYFHEDFRGWANGDAMPRDKASSKMWNTLALETNDRLVSEIWPVGIQVFDNIAIVQYYFKYANKNSEGKLENVRGRWTDILMKQGDRWVVIADHGGVTSKD